MDKFKTIKQNTESELTEKKSRFIANCFKISSVEEAENIIKQTKKKYHDARHNCFAYSVVEDGNIITKFSDDGEPSGTAGAPMLNILTSSDISNTLVIVTRYFGGILLGTGGLVRAYSDVTKKVIEKAEVIEQKLGIRVEIEVLYSDYDKAKYYFQQNNISTVDAQYVENILVLLDMQINTYNEMIKNINNLNFKILTYKVVGNIFV